jgi:hypothetical protein
VLKAMRTTLLLLTSFSLLAQTNLTSPVTILPASGRTATGPLLFRDQQSPFHYVGLQAPSTVSANTVWQLPAADSAGCLQSNGSLVLSFASCTGVLGLPSPYGSFSELQNLLLNSETIGGTGWTLVNSETATQNAALSPNNVLSTATKLSNGGSSGGAAKQTAIASASAVNYTLSVWAQQGSSSQIAIGLYDSTASAWVSGSPATFTLTSAWQRISVSGTPTASHALVAYIFADGNTSTSSEYNYVWGAQVDTAASGAAFSYLRTDNAAWPLGNDPWAQASPFAGAVVNGNLVQTNPNVTNWFSAPSIFNGVLTSNAPSGGAAINSLQGWIQSGGGFVSDVSGGSWEGINSNTDGALLRGYGVAQTTAGTTGGYVDFATITYPPTTGYTCYDAFGNVVNQPAPLNGLSSFGANDVILWASPSPLQGYHSPFTTYGGATYWQTGTACASPLAIPTTSGLNSNGYGFFRDGVASGVGAYNAIQAYNGGGMLAQAFTAAGLYAPGTQLRAGFTVNPYDTNTTLDGSGRVSNQYGTYLGGYVYTGFSDQDPGGPSGTCTSIGTCDNPFVASEGLKPGEMSYNTSVTAFGTTGCERVYTGVAWTCILTAASSPWTLSSSNLYPSSTSYSVLVGETSNSSGAKFEVNGSINAFGPIQSAVTSGYAFIVNNSSTDEVLVDYLGDITAQGNLVNTGYVTTKTWLGLPPTSSAPASAPGSSYGALSYKSGSTYWYYNATTPGWASVDLSAISSQWTLSGSNLYPSSTSYSVLVGETSNSSGAALEVNGSVSTQGSASFFQSTATGSNYAFKLSNSNFIVDGNGNGSFYGTVNLTGSGTYNVGGTVVIDNNRNGILNSCNGCGPNNLGVFYTNGSGSGRAVSTSYQNSSTPLTTRWVSMQLASLSGTCIYIWYEGSSSAANEINRNVATNTTPYVSYTFPVPPSWYYEVAQSGAGVCSITDWVEWN